MLLGEWLIRKKQLTQSQLDEALEEQKKNHEFLGSILVRKQFIKITDLLKALSDTNRPMLLGELLIAKGLLTQSQLDEALAEQKKTRELLGTILIRKKFVKEDDFLTSLSKQFRIP